MNISEIYEKYNIMPNLREHQLRVAGVASLISDNFQKPIDIRAIISAALLHDMGNIIKSDFDKFPEFLKSKGRTYWERVKKDFVEKYGNDEKVAAIEIAKELKVSPKVFDLVSSYGFLKARQTYETENHEVKICVYSDFRVHPFGIRTLEERLEDIKKRYVTDKPGSVFKLDEFNTLKVYWQKVEMQVFKHCKIKPHEINSTTITPIIEKLADFEIETV